MAGSEWQKSSFSDSPDQDCVELATAAGSLLLRESDDPAAVLTARPARVAAMLAAIKGGGWTSRG
ncbi:DUF397 domain-containing protein [Streptomyces sp. 8K308]|uniref:DUF397 domain-containing protein n=1 Tax=Streptomyces sp. 8K308 TaxID=2530388 RepID=UPI00104962E3|nr:DUF397 domain-containing protein [Streptomyces sp. 8K308]TDC10397.1 DUF397 domain-containing protein [Streptomyces sp. 8K308]